MRLAFGDELGKWWKPDRNRHTNLVARVCLCISDGPSLQEHKKGLGQTWIEAAWRNIYDLLTDLFCCYSLSFYRDKVYYHNT